MVTPAARWMKSNHVETSGAYPPKAYKAYLSGQATIQCRVVDNGGLDGCSVVDEQPSNWGFGSAAMLLRHDFLIEHKGFDGKPTAGRTAVYTVIFNYPPCQLPIPDRDPMLCTLGFGYGLPSAY
jgi:protein TonB